MINYNVAYGMDNNYSCGMNPIYNGYNYYGNMGYHINCPYSAFHNNFINNYRGGCPYSENYYQYSPVVHSIVPTCGMDTNLNNRQSFPNNGELRMRTVSIEDIRD